MHENWRGMTSPGASAKPGFWHRHGSWPAQSFRQNSFHRLPVLSSLSSLYLLRLAGFARQINPYIPRLYLALTPVTSRGVFPSKGSVSARDSVSTGLASHERNGPARRCPNSKRFSPDLMSCAFRLPRGTSCTYRFSV